jgi:hypothetical protein
VSTSEKNLKLMVFMITDKPQYTLDLWCQKYSSPSDVLFKLEIGIQLLRLLQTLHDCGYAYNSLDKNNVIINYDNSKKMHVSLVNYNSSSKLYEKNGAHIKQKARALTSFEQDLTFASLSQMELTSTSRKSDLESLCYLLVNILNDGVMPFSKDYQAFSLQDNIKQGSDYKTLFCKHLHYKRQVTLRRLVSHIKISQQN